MRVMLPAVAVPGNSCRQRGERGWKEGLRDLNPSILWHCMDLVHTARIVCGTLTATSWFLCLVAPPSGVAYTINLIMLPLDTAGTLHLTSAMLGVTSLTVIFLGTDGTDSELKLYANYS